MLFRPHEECPGFVVVTAGTIRVSLTAANGREITLYRVHPGEICLQTFNCLVEDRPYSAEGIAETDLEAVLIPRSEFRRLIADDADFQKMFLAAIAYRFGDFERLIEDVALSGMEARLARALLERADADGIVRQTHEALAIETGSARAVVTRKLAVFTRRGWIERRRGQVILKAPEKLRECMHGDL